MCAVTYFDACRSSEVWRSNLDVSPYFEDLLQECLYKLDAPCTLIPRA